MKKLQMRTSLRTSIRQQLLNMELDQVELYDTSNYNFLYYRTAYNAVRKELEDSDHGKWFSDFDAETSTFRIVRIK